MSKNFDDTKWYSYTSSTQTMRTWARRVEAYENIPKEFQPYFPKPDDDFPYTVHIPADRFSLFHKRNKKIISLYQDNFLLLEAVRNRIETFSNKFTDIVYLERGKILLHSWLKIITLTDSLYIRFNTTNDYLFKPIIEKIRLGMSGDSTDMKVGEDEVGLAKFNYLNSINFKYMNYGKKCVRSNDPIMNIVYQPERCVRELKVFNRPLLKWYATDHLSILTEKELIFIKEEKQTRTNKESLNGGVFTYIPRHKIGNVSFNANAENTLCTMEIALPKNTRLTSEFSLANEGLKELQTSLG